jgi:hypothetical protein
VCLRKARKRTGDHAPCVWQIEPLPEGAGEAETFGDRHLVFTLWQVIGEVVAKQKPG